MDWDNDPELIQMRADFQASLGKRRDLLAPAFTALKAGKEVDDAIKTIQFVAHKLAGVAGSYGFPTLTRVGGAIDEWIDLAGASIARDRARLERMARLLDEAMQEATTTGRDPEAFGRDARLAELTSAGGSPASGARS